MAMETGSPGKIGPADAQTFEVGGKLEGAVERGFAGPSGPGEVPVVNPAEPTPEIVGSLRKASPLGPAPEVVETSEGESREKVPGEAGGQDSRAKREQLAEIRRALVEERTLLMDQYRKAAKDGTIRGDSEPGDVCDLSAQDIERNIFVSLRERDRAKLRAIEEALERIQDGSFGVCEECESPIPLGRLKIMPFATTCVACKSRLEKQEKMLKAPEGEGDLPYYYNSHE